MTWLHVFNMQGMAFINGRPTIVYLEHDEHQRLVWSMPLEEFQIVCDKPFVLIKTKFSQDGDRRMKEITMKKEDDTFKPISVLSRKEIATTLGVSICILDSW